MGIDGCGKTSNFHGALDMLSRRLRVTGVGDVVLSGGPDAPPHERTDIPASRRIQRLGRFVKGLHWQGLYKNLKFLELAGRTRIAAYTATHDRPDVILADGDPLINTAAWAVARFYREDLVTSDDELLAVLDYLTGDRTIPVRKLPYYLRRAPQLVALNRLRLARFTLPDLIVLLDIDPAIAMTRIRARGKPLQTHETEAFLTELRGAYLRVCRLVEQRRGIAVVRIDVDDGQAETTVQRVAAAVLEQVANRRDGDMVEATGAAQIDVIATTMSGSIQDQRKIGQIGPEFRARTSRPVRVTTADSHAEAQQAAHTIVAGGGRLLVSAGGAGTFNAVLEGAHIDGGIPPDLRLAFLRKGSADLIGKVLAIPDQLPDAVQAIIAGIESGHDLPADVLAVEAAEPDGTVQRRHMVGFGGFGIFGEVPRFTETRLIKYYKGVLGTLFGDLGPFFTGLALSAVWWLGQRLRGRTPGIRLRLDGEPVGPGPWGAVVVLNGDLGDDFPLGRGVSLGGGDFRVVALRYQGVRQMLRQVRAARSGRLIEQPEQYGAVVRTVRSLEVAPVRLYPYMVNVDGLRMITRGHVHVSVSGRVILIAGGAA